MRAFTSTTDTTRNHGWVYHGSPNVMANLGMEARSGFRHTSECTSSAGSVVLTKEEGGGTANVRSTVMYEAPQSAANQTWSWSQTSEADRLANEGERAGFVGPQWTIAVP